MTFEVKPVRLGSLSLFSPLIPATATHPSTMQPEKKAGGNSARFYHRVVDMACSVLCSCCADDVSIKSPDPSTPTDRVPSPPTSGGSRPPNTPFRPFKRSSSGLEGYKKDVAILSTVYLFQDHVTLKRLAVLLASNARHEDEGDSEVCILRYAASPLVLLT